MDNDDRLIGRVLTRREVIALLGAAGAVMLTGCLPGESNSSTPTAGATQPPTSAEAGTTQTPLNEEAATAVASTPVEVSPTADAAAAPDCVVRPEMTEGPYFVDEKLDRSDIRSDPTSGSLREGVPLALAFAVSQVGTGSCLPLKDAQVDVWHCDALGTYSDVSGNSEKFLRGYQLTDANGNAKFTTIYPGWYRGRAVHIHFKIRATDASNQNYEFTSQLFFDDAFSDQVYTQQPYSQHSGRDTPNSADNIYSGGGSQMTLAPTKSGDGYAATFSIGLDLSDANTGASDSNQQGGGMPGGPPNGTRQP